VIDGDALRTEASAVAADRLRRAGGLLSTVAPGERDAIESLARAVALRVAEGLLDRAARDSLVAYALAACYPVGTASQPVAGAVTRTTRVGASAASIS
jgi:hypothetical protein